MGKDLVVCKNCNWVHFSVTRDYIKKWEEQWEEYFKTLDDAGKEAFGLKDNPPTADDEYYSCFRCRGSYKNCRDMDTTDPDMFGHTIQPILHWSE